jgi:DeoR family transcriptional regulator of aga operon
MLAGTRKHEIMKMLELRQQMTIPELAETFNVRK